MIKKLSVSAACLLMTCMCYAPVYAEDDIPTTAIQSTISEAGKSVPSPGAGWCAAWVESVYAKCGFKISGNANDLWAKYCKSTDRDELEPGMLIAVRRSSGSGLGYTYGHVGIYVGDGMVMHNTGTIQTTPLDEWIEQCNYDGSVAWGYPEAVQKVVDKEQATIIEELKKAAEEAAAKTALGDIAVLNKDLSRTATMAHVNEKDN